MSGSRRPTLKDIAADTGLSMAAVSYALRGLHGTPETRQRVQEAAERLGYQADPVARALASGRSGSIGVLCASLEDLWQQRLAAGLGRELLAPDRNAWIIDSAGDPVRQLELAQHLVDHRADAIVVIPIDPAAEGWASIAQAVPVIAIGDALPAAKAKSEVLFDNATGVSTALRRLADAGHRQVAVLSPSRWVDVPRPAEVIAERVAAELDLTLSIIPCPHDLPGATEVARRLLADPGEAGPGEDREADASAVREQDPGFTGAREVKGEAGRARGGAGEVAPEVVGGAGEVGAEAVRELPGGARDGAGGVVREVAGGAQRKSGVVQQVGAGGREGLGGEEGGGRVTGGRPTGILALADSMAFGVYAACRELGLRVPEDISLVGYDDQPMSQLLSPPLSTLHWPLDDLVTHVVTRVASAVDSNRRVRRTTLTPTLIERASVAAPPPLT